MILFFSKIDQESMMIRNEISKDAELKDIVQFVSVDSKQVHDIISTSKNVIIDHVPCLLSVTEQSISKYEGGQKIMELLAEIKSNIVQKQKTPAYTSLTEINLEPEEEPEDEEISMPIQMQQQSNGSIPRDNVSPEKIKITSPVFAQPTAKKK